MPVSRINQLLTAMKLPVMRITAYAAMMIALAIPIHGMTFSSLNRSGRTPRHGDGPDHQRDAHA